MKILSLLFISCLMTLSIVACNRGDSNGSAAPPVIAQPPPPACVPGTQPHDPNCMGYNGFSQFGFQPYGHAYSHGHGYCNCEPGFRPVYGHLGLGCVQTETIRPFPGVYFYAGALPVPPANNYQNNSIPQFSNITGYPQVAQPGCFNNVAVSCFVTQPNTCGPGRLCRPTGPGSALGVCINQ